MNEEEDIPTARNQQIVVASPHIHPKAPNFLLSTTFWEESIFLNPAAFNPLIRNYPKIPLGSNVNSAICEQILSNILSKKAVRDDLTDLSSTILATYALKNPLLLHDNFNPNFFSDKAVLRQAIQTFVRIINTPDPNRAIGHEWKVQTFTRTFSYLWTALNGTEEDLKLNTRLRAEIGFVVGLHPFFNFNKMFKINYPNLAKHIQSCTKQVPNLSQKPIHTVFILSLMHALTIKVPRPLFITSLYQDEDTPHTSHLHLKKPFTVPNKLTKIKNSTPSKNPTYGRRNSLKFDSRGNIINPNKANPPRKENDSDSDDENNEDIGAFVLPVSTLQNIDWDFFANKK